MEQINRVENAVSLFLSGFSCSQAILASYSSLIGLDKEIALKLAGGFGGGIGGTAKICGAISGSIMVLSYKNSPTKANDSSQKAHNYLIIQEFIKKFEEQTSVTNCKDILNYDISIPAEKEKAKELNLFKTICPECVRLSALILEEMLNE